ncbi:TIGR00730 family Rossman fold protein [Facklamia sp. 7083-14-GEN3]|uniref:LOG family protein n=1 Tax=Facklamia sp. 7083-14-GEN3 TaxID=2973478 RepID=UPI00215BA610|nr:TIGR00730 family Rossman fold protein [Facklamia sp. 7083-14-GEN3]MCR8969623.1 TIGR00730 family Rossman fold protein [Facklamia sp. 7083-14-GEN3]
MKVAVYCGASRGNNPIYRQAAIELGEWLALNNHSLIYGGGKTGLMGDLANAVLEKGGKVIGVMPKFLLETEIGHQGLTDFVVVETMAQRKQKMLDLSDLCIALPGGPGTLEEIIEAISWHRVGQSSNPCLFMNINGYYNGVQKFYQQMVEEGFLRASDYQRIGFLTHMDKINPFLKQIYQIDQSKS